MNPVRYRLPAFLAYILSVFGWIYVLVFHRKNAFAYFHVKQSMGLLFFSLGTTIAWLLLWWVLAWIPFGPVVGMALFGLVIAAYIFSLVGWVIGMVRALRDEAVPLPFIGMMADRMPLEKIFR